MRTQILYFSYNVNDTLYMEALLLKLDHGRNLNGSATGSNHRLVTAPSKSKPAQCPHSSFHQVHTSAVDFTHPHACFCSERSHIQKDKTCGERSLADAASKSGSVTLVILSLMTSFTQVMSLYEEGTH